MFSLPQVCRLCFRMTESALVDEMATVVLWQHARRLPTLVGRPCNDSIAGLQEAPGPRRPMCVAIVFDPTEPLRSGAPRVVIGC
jgi:hypothetical protein